MNSSLFRASIRECQHEDAERWNRFVQSHTNSTYCHRFEWKPIIETAYGLKTYYLVLTLMQQWLAVFPVVTTPSISGRATRAVSIAYGNYGDVLCRSDIDSETARKYFVDYLCLKGIRFIEVRCRKEGNSCSSDISLELSLPSQVSTLWQTIGSNRRRKIRRAIRNGITTQWDRKCVDDMFEVYAENMQSKGTPVHHREYFQNIVRYFADDSEVLTVHYDGKIIAAMLIVKHGDTWAAPTITSVPRYNSMYTNMLLYWEALRSACDYQVKVFDFGRSRIGSGTYQFKKQWGATSVALSYFQYVDGVRFEKTITDSYHSRLGHVASACWKQLPSMVQRNLGPMIRRWMP